MSKPDRREFLKGSAAALGTLALTWPSAAVAAEPWPDIVDVGGGDPAARVKAALDALGGLGRFVHPGDKVALKPNLGFDSPRDWGANTDAAVVAAVARACVDAGAASVRVLEHPVTNGERALKRSGVGAALAGMQRVQVKLLGDSKDFKEVPIRGGVSLKKTKVARELLDADVYINLPVAKSHGSAGVTFGMKNAMGLIYSRKPLHFLYDLDQSIADLARVIRPQLTMLDATRAMITGGPKGPGDVVKPARLIAGANVVSVDAYGLGVANFNNRRLSPGDVEHIALAAAAGLGQADVSKLRVKRVTI